MTSSTPQPDTGADERAVDDEAVAHQRPKRPHYEGSPTLGAVMRRPRWILALILALIVAGGFAWLGQWQMSFAISLNNDAENITEVPRPISEVTEPGIAVSDAAGGMTVTTEGVFVPGDFVVVNNRTNDGELGAWLTGHLESNDGALAVAIGWAPTMEEAQAAAAAIDARLSGAAIAETEIAETEVTSESVESGSLVGETPWGVTDVVIEGRYMPSDAAVVPKPDEDPMVVTSMVSAQLVNLWAPFESKAHVGYLVLHPGASPSFSADSLEELGLQPIDSVPPLPVETINWLNLFYAVEWVVFAGFAVYFWYRLTRDAWEKEHELKLLEQAE